MFQRQQINPILAKHVNRGSIELQKNLALRLILYWLSRGFDESLHRENLSNFLFEYGTIFYKIFLHLFELFVGDGLQVGIEPKPANKLVFEIELCQVDWAEIFLTEPAVIHHDWVFWKVVEGKPCETATNAVQKGSIFTVCEQFL